MGTTRLDHVERLVITASGGKSFVRTVMADGKLQIAEQGEDGLMRYPEMTIEEAEQKFGEKQRMYNIHTARIAMGVIALIALVVTYFWPAITAFLGGN